MMIKEKYGIVNDKVCILGHTDEDSFPLEQEVIANTLNHLEKLIWEQYEKLSGIRNLLDDEKPSIYLGECDGVE